MTAEEFNAAIVPTIEKPVVFHHIASGQRYAYTARRYETHCRMAAELGADPHQGYRMEHYCQMNPR